MLKGNSELKRSLVVNLYQRDIKISEIVKNTGLRKSGV